MPELTPSVIHQQDQDRIFEVRQALQTHISDNNEQFRLTTISDIETKAQLSIITTTLESWTPYITEGIKKSDAYKLVAADLKNKGKDIKWWIGFVIILFTFISSVYLVIERINPDRSNDATRTVGK
jgi:hypothetical protein